VKTPKVCPAKPCFTTQCTPATGECVYTAINCDDGNKCNTGQLCDISTGACPAKVPVICPSDTCNTGSCDPLTGNCGSKLLTCDDGLDCTHDSCVVGVGCQNVRDDAVCASSNICADSKCTGTVPGKPACIETPKVNFCDQNVNGTNPFCSDQICRDFQGCVSIPKNCNNSNQQNQCDTYECSETAKQNQPVGCQKVDRKCANLGAVIGAVVGAGAAVGIALGAAIVAGLCVAGAATAAAQTYKQDTDQQVYTNPTYTNPVQSSSGLG
jgi:hypothetical protein